MGKYLLRYKGKYRVNAESDLGTKEFIRDETGNLDSSFDDFYIQCKSGGKIMHHQRSLLCFMIPNLTKGTNVKKRLNEINKDIIFDFRQNDLDTMIIFKSEYIDIVASIVGAKTSGANISPFSVRNLPKSDFKIPKEDLAKYKEIIKPLNKKVDVKFYNEIYLDFYKIIQKRKGKRFNITKEMKKEKLKGKEFIYKLGFWEEFLQYLDIIIKEMGKSDDK